jgi:hypothetical protein
MPSAVFAHGTRKDDNSDFRTGAERSGECPHCHKKILLSENGTKIEACAHFDYVERKTIRMDFSKEFTTKYPNGKIIEFFHFNDKGVGERKGVTIRRIQGRPTKVDDRESSDDDFSDGFEARCPIKSGDYDHDHFGRRALAYYKKGKLQTDGCIHLEEFEPNTGTFIFIEKAASGNKRDIRSAETVLPAARSLLEKGTGSQMRFCMEVGS